MTRSYREIATITGKSKSLVEKDLRVVGEGIEKLDPRYVVSLISIGIKLYGAEAVKEMLGKKGLKNLGFYLNEVDNHLCL